MFVDSARLTVRAGSGGRGCSSFRREKFVPRGGPNGGDGGRGGSVIFEVNPGFNTLLHVHHKRLVRAEHGSNGGGSNQTGACADDVIIFVPPGTLVIDAITDDVIGDLIDEGQQLVIAQGGRGGRGNSRFRSATNRAPRRADPGEGGEEKELRLELKLMANIGLVGLPNAGKSTLLSRISAARPKVAAYAFTTIKPHLGVVSSLSDTFHTLVVADIPGLIEGAHEGAGLGIQFLRHIERCQALAHLIDLSNPDDCQARVESIRNELFAYSESLHQRQWILVGTKLDAVEDREEALKILDETAQVFGVEARAISAVTGDGIPEITGLLFNLYERCEET